MLAQPGILWPFQSIYKLWLSRLSKKNSMSQNRIFSALLVAPPKDPNSALTIRFWDIEDNMLRRETHSLQML
jgi:hypothetical protein